MSVGAHWPQGGQRLLVTVVPLAVAVGVLWPLLAPRAQCYAPEGPCLFFAGDMSNVFFRIDATFALLSLAAGVISGLLLNGAWLSRGLSYQVAAVVASTTLSIAVVKTVEAFIQPAPLAGARPEFIENVFFLGSPSAYLIWAFAQQLTFAISGPRQPTVIS
jgi:hypothetical protein